MRHRVAHRKLGRKTEHRLATLNNLAAALFTHERIETTLFKAKELRPYAERMITRARRDSLHSRRLVARRLGDRALVKRLFDEIAPRFSDRAGGYTRIIRTSPRRGDDAEMAIIELVVRKEQEKAPAKAPSGKGAKAEKPEAAGAAETEEKKPAKTAKAKPAKPGKAKKAAKRAKPAKAEKSKKADKSAEKTAGGRRKAAGGEGGRGGRRTSARTPKHER